MANLIARGRASGRDQRSRAWPAMTVLVLVVLVACSFTPEEQVERDVLTFLERKYERRFAISRYVQRMSHEGNGFADYHDIEAHPVGVEGRPFHVKVLYGDGRIIIHDDGYHPYTDRGRATRAALDSILDTYDDAHAFRIREAGLTELESREALETYRFDEDAYGLQYTFVIASFTAGHDDPALIRRMLREIIDHFDETVTCLRIDVVTKPAADHRADISYSEVRPPFSQSGTIQLDGDRLADFDGSFDSVARYLDHWDVVCPTYYPGPA